MVFFDRCLCWKDLKKASIAAVIFSMTTSFVQVFMQVALWTSFKFPGRMIQNVLYIIYLPLGVLDILVILSGVLLLIGLEKGKGGRYILLPWLLTAAINILYETAVNMYFFYITFRAETGTDVERKPDLMLVNLQNTSLLSEVIVLLVYWVVKFCIYVGGILCVISSYQMINAENQLEKEALLERVKACQAPNNLNQSETDRNQFGKVSSAPGAGTVRSCTGPSDNMCGLGRNRLQAGGYTTLPGRQQAPARYPPPPPREYPWRKQFGRSETMPPYYSHSQGMRIYN